MGGADRHNHNKIHRVYQAGIMGAPVFVWLMIANLTSVNPLFVMVAVMIYAAGVYFIAECMGLYVDARLSSAFANMPTAALLDLIVQTDNSPDVVRRIENTLAERRFAG